MKKTISINIGGVIFHIEEDGYEKLRNYLGSVQRYFASFADSKEILSDIEGRIAERFIAKQKAESKQAISLGDVDELIAAMGTVADFEAIEQAEDLLTEPLGAAPTRPEPSGTRAATASPPPRTEAEGTPAPRRLYRDLRRKILGGVAAGLAHYFTVDPLWIRLIFLVLVLGLPAFVGATDGPGEFGASVSALTVVLYIAMWVAFPGSNALEEDKSIKKFYRDPDRKVVGGVAAGVASYFGVDVGVVRFLWVLSIAFFGTGLLLYIVLWIISPTANTLTEKMEMQGEPITLSNIETNVKRSLKLEETPSGETTLTRLLLFPFRAIAAIINGLGRLLKGIGPILRVVIGALLIASAVLGLLGLVVGGGIGLGMREAAPFADIPPLMFLQEAPPTLVFSLALVACIPLVVILLLGLTLVANRRVVSGTVWLTLAGLWVVGIIGTASTGVVYQQNFARRGEVLQTDLYAVSGTPLLDEYDNTSGDRGYWGVNVDLEGYFGDSIRVERERSARGRSREDAQNNAMALNYNIVQQDSVLRFDGEATLDRGGKYRDQEVRVRVFLPYDQPFAMTRTFFYQKVSDWESRRRFRRLEEEGDREDWKNLRWAVKQDSGLVCLNLPEKYRVDPDEERDDRDAFYDGSSGAVDLGQPGSFGKEYPARDFQRIDIGGAYSIEIRQGDRFSVSADGDRDDVEEVIVAVDDGTLVVKRENDSDFLNVRERRVGLRITMPDVRAIQLSGAHKARIAGFSQLDRLNLTLSGATESEVEVEANRLELVASGASKTTLRGRARSADISLAGACRLNATEMDIDEANVKAVGASRAEMGRVGRISKTTIGASKVDVRE